MTPDVIAINVIQKLGVQLQLTASLLCLLLGLVLARGLGRTPWLRWWTAAFGAIAVAVFALLVRFFGIPLIPLAVLQIPESTLVTILYALYAAAKLLFYLCLLAGTWLFVTRAALPRSGIWAGLALVVGVAAVFILSPSELNPLMVWQAGFAVPMLLACSGLLLRMPPALRTRGSRVLAATFAALAALWVIYIPGFLQGEALGASAAGRAVRWLVSHNSYADTLFEFLLGFGMILAVLDDVFRQAEEARARRHREVAESEARLAQIIRAASDGILLLDAGRRIVHGNPAALEMLGVSGSDLAGMTFDRFLTVAALDEFRATAEDPARPPTGTSGGHRLVGRRADGTEFPMELSLRAITLDGADGFVLSVRDRTQQVREDAERARTQVQLAEAARMEAMSRMVSGVAHELNNPLTAILAFAQDLAGHPRNPSDVEALHTIVTQAQRCRAIVQDLLITARSTRAAREVMQLAEVVTRAIPALERQAAERQVQLRVDVAPGLPPVEATPAAMEQVLTNLVVNAFQALGRGGTTRIMVASQGDRVVLLVEDDGPGIPPEVLPRLFEPFFTTKAPGDGTGLGLAVSRALVEQHGGTLVAENRVGPDGPGARFTVALPALDRRAWGRVPAVPTGAADAVAAGRRVLVVDDEAAIRMALRRFLERRGWTVEEAGDGGEALRVLGLGTGPGAVAPPRFDAIVTDLRMPGLSGIELHDRLAAAAPGLLARLVLLTGDTASAEVAEFISRVRQPLLQKPFDLPELADLLERIAPAPSAAPAS